MKYAWHGAIAGFGIYSILTATLVHCVGDEPAAVANQGDGGASDVVAPGDGQPTGTAQLVLGKTRVWVQQGGNGSVPFTITRGTASGPLVVHATGMPTGITAADVTVADGASSGMLSFNAAASAPLGVVTTVSVELQSNAQALDQKTITVGASGTPGSLDTTFGTAGVASVPLSVDGGAPTLLSGGLIALYTTGTNAGKVLLGGTIQISPTIVDYVVVRLNVDGSLDTTFGLANGGVRFGYQAFNLGTTDGETLLRSIAIDSLDRILVFGRHDSGGTHAELARLTTSGDVDGSYATYVHNMHPTDLGFSGEPRSVAVASGDAPVIASDWNTTNNNTETTLLKLTSAGAIDSTFAVGPSNTYPTTLQLPERASTLLSGLVIDSAGHLWSAGQECAGGAAGVNPFPPCDAVIARATPAGVLDTTFGDVGSDGGKVGAIFVRTSDGGTSSNPGEASVTIAPGSGDLIAAGYDESATLSTIDRYKSDGTLVTTFGTNGHVLLNAVPGSTYQSATNALVDGDGNIVVVGVRSTPGEVYHARLNGTTGALDTSYAEQGVGTSPLGPGASPTGVLLPDGRLVISAVIPGASPELAAYRYWP